MSAHHIVQPRTYFNVLILLMALMFLTIAASHWHINPVMNLLLALLIAFTKMSFIVLFFMHVKYGTNLTRIFAGAGFFWLIIFFTLLFADYMGRIYGTSPFTANPYGG